MGFETISTCYATGLLGITAPELRGTQQQVAALLFAFSSLSWLVLFDVLLPTSLASETRLVVAVLLSTLVTVCIVLSFWLIRSSILSHVIVLVQVTPTLFAAYETRHSTGTERHTWFFLLAVSIAGLLFGVRALWLSRQRRAA